MTRFTIVAAAILLSAGPTYAQFQVPPGCIELAAREGFPTDTLTKIQAARARIRLARLSKRDPLVQQCRSAVQQAQAMMKSMQKSQKSNELALQSIP
jgi:hypothetical protein